MAAPSTTGAVLLSAGGGSARARCPGAGCTAPTHGALSGSGLGDLYERAAVAGDDIQAALAIAVDVGGAVPLPGSGDTAARWSTLATLGAADLTVARVVEPHLDALAIVAEADAAGHPVELSRVNGGAGTSWGVFAAEGPGVRLTATYGADGWTLSGTKPWCSLADRLSHALITAHTQSGRQLFAIALRHNSIRTHPDVWSARGLTHVTSGPIDLIDVPAVPVGPAGWYLNRPGFAWGGIGVAAVWLGGAVALARRVYSHAAAQPDDTLRLLHLGATDAVLSAAIHSVEASVSVIDDLERGDNAAAGLLAARVRAIVADAAESTLLRAAHALGPAPLALDARHARRVADLQLYVRQHHAERDQVALGASLTQLGAPPW